MTIDTVVKELKNSLAPEVKVEQVLTFDPQEKSWFALMDRLSTAFDLEFLQQNGKTYRFKFPGSPVIACSQVKVIWGGTPDEAPYHQLQAYLELSRTDEQTIHLKLFESMIGSPAEQVVYRRVLEQRMERIITHLGED